MFILHGIEPPPTKFRDRATTIQILRPYIKVTQQEGNASNLFGSSRVAEYWITVSKIKTFWTQRLGIFEERWLTKSDTWCNLMTKIQLFFFFSCRLKQYLAPNVEAREEMFTSFQFFSTDTLASQEAQNGITGQD